jgi:hypothetical protein
MENNRSPISVVWFPAETRYGLSCSFLLKDELPKMATKEGGKLDESIKKGERRGVE